MHVHHGAVPRPHLDLSTDDLQALQLRKHPIQNPLLRPAVHPGVPGVPGAEVGRQPAPRASLLGHVQDGVKTDRWLSETLPRCFGKTGVMRSYWACVSSMTENPLHEQKGGGGWSIPHVELTCLRAGTRSDSSGGDRNHGRSPKRSGSTRRRPPLPWEMLSTGPLLRSQWRWQVPNFSTFGVLPYHRERNHNHLHASSNDSLVSRPTLSRGEAR